MAAEQGSPPALGNPQKQTQCRSAAAADSCSQLLTGPVFPLPTCGPAMSCFSMPANVSAQHRDYTGYEIMQSWAEAHAP